MSFMPQHITLSPPVGSYLLTLLTPSHPHHLCPSSTFISPHHLHVSLTSSHSPHIHVHACFDQDYFSYKPLQLPSQSLGLRHSFSLLYWMCYPFFSNNFSSMWISWKKKSTQSRGSSLWFIHYDGSYARQISGLLLNTIYTHPALDFPAVLAAWSRELH